MIANCLFGNLNRTAVILYIYHPLMETFSEMVLSELHYKHLSIEVARI